jgi:hypothetical protein
MQPISEISKLIKFYQTLTIVLTQQKAAARRPFRTGAQLSATANGATQYRVPAADMARPLQYMNRERLNSRIKVSRVLPGDARIVPQRSQATSRRS